MPAINVNACFSEQNFARSPNTYTSTSAGDAEGGFLFILGVFNESISLEIV